LGIIIKHKTISAIDLTHELQLLHGERLRSWIDALLTNGIVISRGTGKGVKYSINPAFVAKSKVQIPTSLKTIEPYRLKALIKEDLRFHPNSLLSEIAQRLPDVEFHELEKMTREMAKNSELNTSGGRRYRRYSLP
jgi:ATP-dependent DNA helicase RecG